MSERVKERLELSLIRQLQMKYGGEAKKSELMTSLGAYNKLDGKGDISTWLEGLSDKGVITIEERWAKEIAAGSPGIYIKLR